MLISMMSWAIEFQSLADVATLHSHMLHDVLNVTNLINFGGTFVFACLWLCISVLFAVVCHLDKTITLILAARLCMCINV